MQNDVTNSNNNNHNGGEGWPNSIARLFWALWSSNGWVYRPQISHFEDKCFEQTEEIRDGDVY